MSPGVTAQRLQAFALLQVLDDQQRDFLAGCARELTFAQGDYLLRQDQPAERFYLLEAGSVVLKVYSPRRGPIPVQTLGPGEPLGWSWLLPPYRWHFDARALEPVQVLAFDAPCLRARMDQDPAFGYPLLRALLAVMARRLQATRLQLLDVYEDHA
ncbi:MAG: cyclic nucleotide-binding domain-containing protein [Candidatus Competibacteraceae bacterium]|nr:cyclic nucleotide-binding domain-containing protein [Candidatus Competibacteraceae bacterium]